MPCCYYLCKCQVVDKHTMIDATEKSDGLLKSIAYQIKSPKNDNQAGDNNSLQEHMTNSFEAERERPVQLDNADTTKKNITNPLTDHTGTRMTSISELES